QRVAVRLAFRDEVGADRAGGARLVLDDDGLAEPLAHLLPDQPRHEIDAAARRKADDDADGMGGILLCRRGLRAERSKQKSEPARPPQPGTHAYPPSGTAPEGHPSAAPTTP